MVKHIIVHPAFAHTLPERGSLKSAVQLHGLPLPILHLIASKLDKAKDLCSFEQVCTLGWEAVKYDDNALWMHLCCSRFHMPRHARLEHGMTWRQLYRYHHQIFYEYLVYRRPDKLVNLGNGVTWLNIPVMA